jgi:hypothetical protein
MEDLLEIDPGFSIRSQQWDRDDSQALAQANRPEPRPGACLGRADQYGIIALASLLERHRQADAQQVDLDENKPNGCNGAETAPTIKPSDAPAAADRSAIAFMSACRPS